MGWWRFTRLALEALTMPAADVSACDRAMEQLTHESWLGGVLDRASLPVRAAWLDSRARALAVALGRSVAPAPSAAAFRAWGWMLTVVGATILGVDAIKPLPGCFLSSLVPSLIVVAGLVLMFAAAPVARASADRRSRQKIS
jgi:hypothetical protein